jgi:hypothetical protein
MNQKVKTVYIGKTDIYEWTQGVGKNTLMPILLDSCEELIKKKLEKKLAVRIEAEIRGNSKAFDFVIQQEGVEDTLSKILDWALYEEEYEMCQRVQELVEKVNQF